MTLGETEGEVIWKNGEDPGVPQERHQGLYFGKWFLFSAEVSHFI